MINKVICGDCIEEMKRLPENSVDSIVTDPPYGNTNNTPQNNNHPTVKPIKLMQYLVRLVTPKGGVVLDPFLGSGTTAMAAKSQGFSYIGIEREEEYVKIAKARISSIPKEIQSKLK